MPSWKGAEPGFGPDLPYSPAFCTHRAALTSKRASVTPQGEAFEVFSGRDLSVGEGEGREHPGTQEKSVERIFWR